MNLKLFMKIDKKSSKQNGCCTFCNVSANVCRTTNINRCITCSNINLYMKITYILETCNRLDLDLMNFFLPGLNKYANYHLCKTKYVLFSQRKSFCFWFFVRYQPTYVRWDANSNLSVPRIHGQCLILFWH